MKKIVLILANIIVFVHFNYANSKNLKANVQSATVFLTGAQLFYKNEIAFSKGINEFVFEGVSPYLNQNTISTSAKGDFVILDTKFQIAYPTEESPKKVVSKYKKQIKQVEDSLMEISFLEISILDRKNVLETEKNLLLTNRLMKGEFKKDSLAILKEGMEYLRLRLNNINSELLKVKREEYKVNQLKDLLSEKLNEYNSLEALVMGQQTTKPIEAINEIVVTISSENAGIGSIDFSYFIAQAGWSASYEVRANSGDSKLNLFQMANVYQNSGLVWKDVNLTISTGNPTVSNTKPNLVPLYVNLFSNSIKYPTEIGASIKATQELKATSMDDVATDMEKPITFIPENFLAQINNETLNFTRIDYSIPIKYTINSNNQQHQINIKKNSLNTEFKYVGIPKLDPDAFLTASICNWEDLNLLNGEAKIFFDGSYVGNFGITPNNFSDTILFDLGRDKSILVKRKKLPNVTKDKIFQDSKLVENTIEFTIRNTKSVAIEYCLKDQIPVSGYKEIEIKPIQLSGGKVEEETGIVSWNLKLEPKETKTIKLTYQIKYPLGKKINGV